MGLSFLNKKTWHPGSFGNIEKVWIAEQKHREQEKKQIENMKKLKEERQIEELKKLQVEAGLIPASHLQRLDWMYQGPECTSNIITAEEVLIGKSLKEKSDEKKHFTPVFQESYSNPSNEMFTKIHEDPLFVIKREEYRQKKEIEENPYKMKLLLKQVESDLYINKDKIHKKHNKHKKSRSPSPKLTITTPSFLKSQTPQMYGLIDKQGNKIDLKGKNLGPDEELFKERKVYNKVNSDIKYNLKNLSNDEKDKLRREMENKARELDSKKHISTNNILPVKNYSINEIGKQIYSGELDLEEQLRRKGKKYKN